MASRASVLIGFFVLLAWMVTDGMGWAPRLARVLQILGIAGVAVGLLFAIAAGWIRGAELSGPPKR
jgi:hypothetical protein